MSYCERCGAYIPIGDTACPACGFDPEEEARRAREEAEAEERRRAEAEAEARRREEEAAEKKRRQEEETRRRTEEARRRDEQARRWQQDPRKQQGYTGGAAQSQYASQRTGQSGSQYSSQRTGQSWAPPWKEQQQHGGSQSAPRPGYGSQTYGTGQSYEDMRRRAADSANNRNLSILSYLGPLFLIPMITRREDDFAQFHARQGLSLFVTSAALNLVCGAMGIGTGLAGLVSLAGMIFGISNVIRGKKEPLPLIGNLFRKK